MVQLRSLDGRIVHELPEGDTIIGRSSQECNIQIRTSKSISGKHARILVDTDAYGDPRIHIQDLCSKNGIFVNGTHFVGGSMASLDHGDTVRFGYDEQRFVISCTDEPIEIDLGLSSAELSEPTLLSFPETPILIKESRSGDSISTTQEKLSNLDTISPTTNLSRRIDKVESFLSPEANKLSKLSETIDKVRGDGKAWAKKTAKPNSSTTDKIVRWCVRSKLVSRVFLKWRAYFQQRKYAHTLVANYLSISYRQSLLKQARKFLGLLKLETRRSSCIVRVLARNHQRHQLYAWNRLSQNVQLGKNYGILFSRAQRRKLARVFHDWRLNVFQIKKMCRYIATTRTRRLRMMFNIWKVQISNEETVRYNDVVEELRVSEQSGALKGINHILFRFKFNRLRVALSRWKSLHTDDCDENLKLTKWNQLLFKIHAAWQSKTASAFFQWKYLLNLHPRAVKKQEDLDTSQADKAVNFRKLRGRYYNKLTYFHRWVKSGEDRKRMSLVIKRSVVKFAARLKSMSFESWRGWVEHRQEKKRLLLKVFTRTQYHRGLDPLIRNCFLNKNVEVKASDKLRIASLLQKSHTRKVCPLFQHWKQVTKKNMFERVLVIRYRQRCSIQLRKRSFKQWAVVTQKHSHALHLAQRFAIAKEQNLQFKYFFIWKQPAGFKQMSLKNILRKTSKRRMGQFFRIWAAIDKKSTNGSLIQNCIANTLIDIKRCCFLKWHVFLKTQLGARKIRGLGIRKLVSVFEKRQRKKVVRTFAKWSEQLALVKWLASRLLQCTNQKPNEAFQTWRLQSHLIGQHRNSQVEYVKDARYRALQLLYKRFRLLMLRLNWNLFRRHIKLRKVLQRLVSKLVQRESFKAIQTWKMIHVKRTVASRNLQHNLARFGTKRLHSINERSFSAWKMHIRTASTRRDSLKTLSTRRSTDLMKIAFLQWKRRSLQKKGLLMLSLQHWRGKRGVAFQRWKIYSIQREGIEIRVKDHRKRVSSLFAKKLFLLWKKLIQRRRKSAEMFSRVTKKNMRRLFHTWTFLVITGKETFSKARVMSLKRDHFCINNSFNAWRLNVSRRQKFTRTMRHALKAKFSKSVSTAFHNWRCSTVELRSLAQIRSTKDSRVEDIISKSHSMEKQLVSLRHNFVDGALQLNHPEVQAAAFSAITGLMAEHFQGDEEVSEILFADYEGDEAFAPEFEDQENNQSSQNRKVKAEEDAINKSELSAKVSSILEKLSSCNDVTAMIVEQSTCIDVLQRQIKILNTQTEHKNNMLANILQNEPKNHKRALLAHLEDMDKTFQELTAVKKIAEEQQKNAAEHIMALESTKDTLKTEISSIVEKYQKKGPNMISN